MKTSLIAISFLLLLSACDLEPAQREKYRYTVHLGTAAVSLGYDTNEYEIQANMITFIKVDGTKTVSPLCSVFQIKVNDTTEVQ